MIYGSYNRELPERNLQSRLKCHQNKFNPETLDAYETGSKSTLFDERLRLNTGFLLS